MFDNMLSVKNQSWLSDISASRTHEIKYVVSDNLIETMPVDEHVREIHVGIGNNNKLRT